MQEDLVGWSPAPFGAELDQRPREGQNRVGMARQAAQSFETVLATRHGALAGQPNPASPAPIEASAPKREPVGESEDSARQEQQADLEGRVVTEQDARLSSLAPATRTNNTQALTNAGPARAPEPSGSSGGDEEGMARLDQQTAFLPRHAAGELPLPAKPREAEAEMRVPPENTARRREFAASWVGPQTSITASGPRRAVERSERNGESTVGLDQRSGRAGMAGPAESEIWMKTGRDAAALLAGRASELPGLPSGKALRDDQASSRLQSLPPPQPPASATSLAYPSSDMPSSEARSAPIQPPPKAAEAVSMPMAPPLQPGVTQEQTVTPERQPKPALSLDRDGVSYAVARSGAEDVDRTMVRGAAGASTTPSLELVGVEKLAHDRAEPRGNLADPPELKGAELSTPARASMEAGVSRTDLPRRLSHQLLEAFQHRATAQRVELQLNPVELGKVKMQMQPLDNIMVIHIVADRPETLDLLRRHADLLAQDFRDFGYGTTRVTFSGSDQRADAGGNEPAADRRRPPDDDSTGADMPDPGQPDPGRAPIHTTERLDIRL